MRSLSRWRNVTNELEPSSPAVFCRWSFPDGNLTVRTASRRSPAPPDFLSGAQVTPCRPPEAKRSKAARVGIRWPWPLFSIGWSTTGSSRHAGRELPPEGQRLGAHAGRTRRLSPVASELNRRIAALMCPVFDRRSVFRFQPALAAGHLTAGSHVKKSISGV